MPSHFKLGRRLRAVIGDRMGDLLRVLNNLESRGELGIPESQSRIGVDELRALLPNIRNRGNRSFIEGLITSAVDPEQGGTRQGGRDPSDPRYRPGGFRWGRILSNRIGEGGERLAGILQRLESAGALGIDANRRLVGLDVLQGAVGGIQDAGDRAFVRGLLDPRAGADIPDRPREGGPIDPGFGGRDTGDLLKSEEAVPATGGGRGRVRNPSQTTEATGNFVLRDGRQFGQFGSSAPSFEQLLADIRGPDLQTLINPIARPVAAPAAAASPIAASLRGTSQPVTGPPTGPPFDPNQGRPNPFPPTKKSGLLGLSINPLARLRDFSFAP